jgi:hypothetical protein
MEHAELAAVHVSLTLYGSPYDRKKEETSILRAKTRGHLRQRGTD